MTPANGLIHLKPWATERPPCCHGIQSTGRFLFVREQGLGTRSIDRAVVVRVDTRTAARQPWLDLQPADRVGVGWVGLVRLSADAQSYVYTYGRDLSNLFLVEGLR
jgi:hypothetical protein